MNATDRCDQYVKDVLAGKVPAPLTIKQACKQYRKDFKNKAIYFDSEAANKAVQFMELLTHAKGRWQGQKVVLENWQCFVVCNIFGWKWVSTGKRRFRYCYMKIARKNGKSFLAILIALVMFGPDMEPGAEVYLGATGQKQASQLLFKPAKYVVEQSPAFMKRYGIEVVASSLMIPANFSSFEAVIKKPDDGTSPHCAIVDEYHLHDDASQFDTFDTGMGAREQPLLMVTTTAGSNQSGPCKSYEDSCIKQLNGDFEDLTRLVIIYGIDEKDDWTDEICLHKANPNINVTQAEEHLKSQLAIAKRDASKQNDFKTKHLNVWVGSASPWMNTLLWQRQSKPRLFKDFEGCPAHGGCDLASMKDCNAVNLTFKNEQDQYYTKTWFFVPEGALEKNPKYQAFANSGELIVTPGVRTDQAAIEAHILELDSQYDVRSWGFDDYQGDYIMTRLADQGVNVVVYGATVKNFSQPMKEIDALTDAGELYNDGNMCMAWMIGNVTCFKDQKDNIFPRKDNKNDEKCKIDGPISLIMSMGRWSQDEETGSLDDFLSNPVTT